jgi:peptidoglycan/xylan/chitin deacetylase (PgdA/CDA1 family)
MSPAAVPILTWHAMSVNGADYATNDLLAFAEDLEKLHALGLRVVALHEIARALREGALERLVGCVGLSFDDGSDFDYRDLPHPAWGPQRGMAGVLEDFRARHGAAAQPGLHATSFTIVSPDARAELDRTCMIGCRWWNDDWYRDAEARGLLSVESHGWDHNHASLRSTQTSAPRGTFDLAHGDDAQAEIGRAAEVLRGLRGRGGDVLFAYPYGHASEFLVREWLPANGDALGIPAAFAASEGEPVTAGASRWKIPRYVFGDHWKSPQDLRALLREARVEPAPRSSPAAAALHGEASRDWRSRLRTWEVNDAQRVAGELFRRAFNHEVPGYPRHFVLVHSREPGSGEPPEVVAYVHHTAREGGVYLCGGMCVDERAYRRFPRWLFEAARDQGGLATIVTRDSVDLLGDCTAVFGHVGEPRARAADLRTGFIDTDREHLMVIWRKAFAESEKRRLVDEVAALGSF